MQWTHLDVCCQDRVVDDQLGLPLVDVPGVQGAFRVGFQLLRAETRGEEWLHLMTVLQKITATICHHCRVS